MALRILEDSVDVEITNCVFAILGHCVVILRLNDEVVTGLQHKFRKQVFLEMRPAGKKAMKICVYERCIVWCRGEYDRDVGIRWKYAERDAWRFGCVDVV